MAVGVAVEVSLAGESRPAGEDREGDDLACGKGGLGTGAALLGTVGLAKVIDDDVECGEEGVHVEHESVPFPTAGLGGKLTLRRGHLPLKSSAPNSHQAFKCATHSGSNVGGKIRGRVRLRPTPTVFHAFHGPDFPPSQIRLCVAGFMTRFAPRKVAPLKSAVASNAYHWKFEVPSGKIVPRKS